MLSAIATLPGCIIPVPIKSQPTPPLSQPVILWQDAAPRFGAITHQATDMDAFELSFPVDDADLDDQIVARLFRDGTSVKIFDAQGLPAFDGSDPERRTVTFGPEPFCLALGASMGATVYLYVVVSDRPFSDSQSDNTAGLTDSSYWVLTCN
jgi:hypothetical protein